MHANARRAVGDGHHVGRIELGAERIDKRVDVYGRLPDLTIFGDVSERIFFAQGYAKAEPVGLAVFADFVFELRHKIGEVCANGDIGLYERFFKLGFVYVHDDFHRVFGEILPVVARLTYVVARAQ